MKPLFVVDRNGVEHLLEAAPERTLMEVLRDAELGLAAICGGGLSCATCHVYIDDPADLPQPSADEAAMTVGLEHYRQGVSRLSCQIALSKVLHPLRITVAPEE